MRFRLQGLDDMQRKLSELKRRVESRMIGGDRKTMSGASWFVCAPDFGVGAKCSPRQSRNMRSGG